MATRILFLAWAPFFSGAERALLLTVRHLDPARYIPTVAVGTDGETLAQLRAAGIDAHHIALAPLERRHPLPGLRSVWAVRRLARRLGAALIHANDAPSYQAGGLAARLLGLPAITHIRFPDTVAGFRWFLRPPPARVLFVSDAIRRDATAIAPTLFEERSDVLHDGVALPPPVTAPARQALRHELQLDGDAPVVALTGQISEIKGIWEFVDAARLIVSRGVPAVFAVLGDDLKTGGAVRRAMEQRVAELGLASHFRFLGFRPNAPALIPAFDLVAVPSHVEPLGNATLEAMAAGVPVVGSRVGGIPEMVAEGESGLLVPPRDPAALADALVRLVSDPVLRQSYGAAARARAESHFSLSLHAGRLQATYDRLLARHQVAEAG